MVTALIWTLIIFVIWFLLGLFVVLTLNLAGWVARKFNQDTFVIINEYVIYPEVDHRQPNFD